MEPILPTSTPAISTLAPGRRPVTELNSATTGTRSPPTSSIFPSRRERYPMQAIPARRNSPTAVSVFPFFIPSLPPCSHNLHGAGDVPLDQLTDDGIGRVLYLRRIPHLDH